jgi:hypothetical protein
MGSNTQSVLEQRSIGVRHGGSSIRDASHNRDFVLVYLPDPRIHSNRTADGLSGELQFSEASCNGSRSAWQILEGKSMRRILTLLIAVSLINLLTSSTFAGGDDRMASVKLEDLTPKGSPLKFRVQKIGWKFDKIRFWGVVTNSGNEGFQFVSVSFTALGPDGQFLGREKTYVDPNKLNGGDSGDINEFALETDGQKPTVIQFKVSGSPL